MPPDSHPHTAVSNRIDLLRGGFALWVFLAHSYDLFLILRAGQTTAAPITWFDTLLRSGHFGVTGFFFLSGFCIHWSISKSLAKHPGFDWKKYFKARFWRIAPLFYCGLLLAVVLEFVILTWLNRVEVWTMPGEKLRNLAGALFFLQGFNGGYGSYAPSWSITYEIIYYIAWPVVLWWAGFRANKAVLLSLGIAFGSMALFYGSQVQVTRGTRFASKAGKARLTPLLSPLPCPGRLQAGSQNEVRGRGGRPGRSEGKAEP